MVALPALAAGRGPDFSRTLLAAQQIKKTGLETQLLESKIGEKKEITSLRQQITSGEGGSRQAFEGMDEKTSSILDRLTRIDPDGTKAWTDRYKEQDEKEREQELQKINTRASFAMQLLQTPQEGWGVAYPQLQAAAQQQGVDTSNWPEPGDPGLGQAMEMMVAQDMGAEGFASYTKDQERTKSDVVEVLHPNGRSGFSTVEDALDPDKGLQPIPSKAGVTVNVGGPQTKGRIEADKAAGKAYNEFIAQGGAADAQKNMEQLREVRDQLRGIVSGDVEGNVTGPVLGSVPPAARTLINPESADVQERVEEVVQRNLRLILGAQFTAKEGERLIARAYNPRLSEAKNADRLDRLLTAMEGAYEAKIEANKYFEENGTLTGYEGTTSFDLGGKSYGVLDDEQGGSSTARRSNIVQEATQTATDADGKKLYLVNNKWMQEDGTLAQ